MIGSFSCRDTEALFYGAHPRRIPPSLHRTALRKLLMLHAATDVLDLRSPPGNRLEALKQERTGQFSIRINDQWRICFRWNKGQPHGVEIVDYH